VVAVLHKFAGGPLSKTRADIISSNPAVDLSPDHRVDLIYDVVRALGAFGGRPYPAPKPLWPCP